MVTEDFLKPELIGPTLGFQPGMNIADFGCGSGEFSVYSAHKVGSEGHITAIDVRTEPLETLRAKLKAARLENVTCARANLELLGSTKLGDASQDKVMLHNVLFQSQKKSEMLAEAFRVLKPGGEAVVIDWKKGSPVRVGAGGFGPPDELRFAPHALEAIAIPLGFKKLRDFDCGRFHFGIIFIK